MPVKALGIVADDLTGAMDSSGYFAGQGLSTVVFLGPDFSSAADIAVINTDSRAEIPDVARERVRGAVRGLAGRMVYKKIDSTLRGNIGIELEAAGEELHSEKIIVAPAFPVAGRTTVGSVLLVNGTSVAETRFASDPVSPVKEAHIPRLLEKSAGRGVGSVSIADIKAGPEFLYRKISEMPQKIVVCDATEQSHLKGIARAGVLAEGRWLLSGSGGLARELSLFLPGVSGGGGAKPADRAPGPALVVVGTRHQATAKQLQKAKDELGLPVMDLEIESLKEEVSAAAMRIVAEAVKLLVPGRGLAISSAFSRYVPAVKQSVPVILAETVKGILASQRFAGLFLSGGDIAMEVCRRLSVAAISVQGEVEPGVPAGEFAGGGYPGMRVVTKAGGFGTESALVRSISYLERGYLP